MEEIDAKSNKTAWHVRTRTHMVPFFDTIDIKINIPSGIGMKLLT